MAAFRRARPASPGTWCSSGLATERQHSRIARRAAGRSCTKTVRAGGGGELLLEGPDLPVCGPPQPGPISSGPRLRAIDRTASLGNGAVESTARTIAGGRPSGRFRAPRTPVSGAPTAAAAAARSATSSRSRRSRSSDDLARSTADGWVAWASTRAPVERHDLAASLGGSGMRVRGRGLGGRRAEGDDQVGPGRSRSRCPARAGNARISAGVSAAQWSRRLPLGRHLKCLTTFVTKTPSRSISRRFERPIQEPHRQARRRASLPGPHDRPAVRRRA